MNRLWAFTGLSLVLLSPPAVRVADAPASTAPEAQRQAEQLNRLPPVVAPLLTHPPVDRSGRSVTGRASYYSNRFDGRKMADGRPFNPNADVAASKTLPLGTTAKVVDVQTGKSSVVKVEDNGPHVAGRVMDVSPGVAGKLGLKKTGVAPVVVKPIAVPLRDGGVKLGAGAADASPQEVREAVKTTRQTAEKR